MGQLPTKITIEDIQLVESVIGLTFKDPAVLKEAISEVKRYNYKLTEERQRRRKKMSWLGDKVLQTAIAQYIFPLHQAKFSKLLEVDGALKSNTALSITSRKIGLSKLVGIEGENVTVLMPQENRQLADLFEAVVGAIFLDQGYDKAYDFLSRRYFLDYKQIDEETRRIFEEIFTRDYEIFVTWIRTEYGLDPQENVWQWPQGMVTWHACVYVGQHKAYGSGTTPNRARYNAIRHFRRFLADQGRHPPTKIFDKPTK